MSGGRGPGPALLLGYANFTIAFLFNLVIPLVPILPRELGTTAGNASWVVTAFFVTGAVASPITGRMADTLGHRRAFLVSAFSLLAGSLICAVAPGLMLLLIGRMLQGLALPLLPLAMSVLRLRAGPRGMARAAGWAAVGLGAGGGLGLVGGGVILDLAGWRGVFWCSAVVSLPLVPLALACIPADTRRQRATRHELDLAGVAGLVALLICLLLPLSKAADWGLGLATVVPLVFIACYLPVWLRGRRRHPHPAVDVSLAARPASAAAHLTAFVAGFSGFTAFVTTAHVLQDDPASGLGFGLSLTETGILMTPAIMSFVVTGPLAGWLMHTRGLRAAVVVGGGTTCIGALVLPWVAHDLVALLVASLVIFLGNGVLMASLPVLVGAASPQWTMSAATGINAFARTAGTALASAAFAAAVALLPHGVATIAALQGMSAVLVAGVVTSTVGAVPKGRAA